jgi:hypothetical protein
VITDKGAYKIELRRLKAIAAGEDAVRRFEVSYETNRRGTPRESPLALGTVAQGARHRTATARATAGRSYRGTASGVSAPD